MLFLKIANRTCICAKTFTQHKDKHQRESCWFHGVKVIILSMYRFLRLEDPRNKVEKQNIFLPSHNLRSKLSGVVERDCLQLSNTIVLLAVIANCTKRRVARLALIYMGKLPVLTMEQLQLVCVLTLFSMIPTE